MAKRRRRGIFAVYKYLDEFCEMLEKSHGKQDFAKCEVYAPTAYHEVEAAMHTPVSPVRFYTLIGALCGTFTGFALCFFVDWDWPLVVGGKTPGLASLPAFVVIGFEMTILFGALATIFGILIHGRLPNPHAQVFDKRIFSDHFGIFVPDVALDGPESKFLKDCGASDIKIIS